MEFLCSSDCPPSHDHPLTDFPVFSVLYTARPNFSFTLVILPYFYAMCVVRFALLYPHPTGVFFVSRATVARSGLRRFVCHFVFILRIRLPTPTQVRLSFSVGTGYGMLLIEQSYFPVVFILSDYCRIGYGTVDTKNEKRRAKCRGTSSRRSMR